MRAFIKDPSTARQMGGISAVAAPLLAAAAITVVGVIVQQPSSLSLPVPALSLLILAASLIVTSINASIWANYTHPEPAGKYTVSIFPPDTISEEEYDLAVRRHGVYKFWVNLARWTYQYGVYALWGGIVVAVIPSPRGSEWWVIPSVLSALYIVGDLALEWFAPKAPREPVYWVVDDEGVEASAEPS
jgi:hypothetical protein